MFRDARLACLLFALTACADSSVPTAPYQAPAAPKVSSLTAITATQQDIRTGTLLHKPLQLPKVVVTDELGEPMQFVKVSFITDGRKFEVYTEQDGTAAMPEWIVRLAGTHVVTASVNDLAVTFTLVTTPSYRLATYRRVSINGVPVTGAQAEPVTLSFYIGPIVEYRGATIDQASTYRAGGAVFSWAIRDYSWDDENIAVNAHATITDDVLAVLYLPGPGWKEEYVLVEGSELWE